MKKILMATTIVAGSLIAMSGANAASVPLTNGVGSLTASVTIVSPLTLDENTQLQFGKIAAVSTGGTATLAPGGTTITGTAGVNGLGGTVAPGNFTIKGTGAITVQATAGAAIGGVQLANFKGLYGSATGAGDNLNAAVSYADPTATGTTLKVGADLVFAASYTATGTIAPSYTLTVLYQ